MKHVLICFLILIIVCDFCLINSYYWTNHFINLSIILDFIYVMVLSNVYLSFSSQFFLQLLTFSLFWLFYLAVSIPQDQTCNNVSCFQIDHRRPRIAALYLTLWDCYSVSSCELTIKTQWACEIDGSSNTCIHVCTLCCLYSLVKHRL